MTHTLRLVVLPLFALTLSAQNKEQKMEQPPHPREVTLQGVLIDAGCRDRSVWNLTRPPEPLNAAMPPSAPESASGQATRGTQAAESGGISVDSKTIGLERQDVTQVVKNADLSARQSDPTCAIKANTRSFALLLRDDRLLDLDDAGTTFATAAVQASAEGRAMLNGKGPGFKPRATVVGTVQGDRIFANEVRLAK
jgi:hypothetical protein